MHALFLCRNNVFKCLDEIEREEIFFSDSNCSELIMHRCEKIKMNECIIN